MSPIVSTATITKLDSEMSLTLGKVHPTCQITFNPDRLYTWISGKSRSFLTLLGPTIFDERGSD